ncbi:hypothetical protein AgCh_009676 [Apium graveolens]
MVKALKTVQSAASFCSTVLGTAVRIPYEVLKQRLQAGIFDNVGEAIVDTWQQYGLKGFFRRTGATLCGEPPGFEDPEFPNFVYKLLKALYGLKQAPRAWYDTLSEFLIKHGFFRGTIDKTPFYKKHGDDMILVHIYVDDIIFGSTNEKFCQRFPKLIQSEYEMSMMGELSYFLGLQVSQRSDGIFISQTKYVKDLLKKFGIVDCSPAFTPMSTTTKLDEDKKGKNVYISRYRVMFGSLLYLTASRPDIMFATWIMA